MSYFIWIIAISVVTCLVDAWLAICSLRKKDLQGRYLGMTLLGSLLATSSYITSIFIQTKALYSVFSSLYFASVTMTVFSMYRFSFEFTAVERDRRRAVEWHLIHAYMCFDVLMMLLDPVTNWVIDYRELTRELSHFTYVMKPLFRMHLYFNYLMVGIFTLRIARRAFRVPKGYRGQYGMALLGILAVVAVNAVYLFVPGPTGYDFLDYSLLGYSLTGLVLYWTLYAYPQRGMAASYRSWIYENLDDGILLFDYDDRLIMTNDKALKLLPQGAAEKGELLEDFMQRSGIWMTGHLEDQSYTLQCYVKKDDVLRPLRCDMHLMRRGERRAGRLLTLNDLLPAHDLLTGFMTMAYLQETGPRAFAAQHQRLTIAMCDINGLSDLNEARGRGAGDRAIQRLAKEMRSCFPEGTVFVRGREAELFCLLRSGGEELAFHCLQELQERLAALPEEDRFTIQTAVHSVPAGGDVFSLLDPAYRIIRTKKLLDCSARHSDILNSLIQVLQETDKDTEAHVQRTQRSAEELGRRIGLNEDELSKLALLAILHDIGKVGIPLDILNKPGKLTPSEWAVIKSHVEKGQRIAASSQELKGIADLILYHHERWDGKGYPTGLSKESIPLLSRVIAVVDSYDAMVHDRSYRRSIGPARAREELKRCAGTQFDPAIVSVFLQMLEEQDRDPEAVEPERRDELLSGMISSDWSVESSGDEAVELHVHQMGCARYVTEMNMSIVSVDEAFTRMTGYTQEDVGTYGLKHLDLLPEEDRQEYMTLLTSLIQEGTAVYLEHRLRCRNGAVLHVFCFGRIFYDSAVRRERIEVIIADAAMSHSIRSLMDAEHAKAFRQLELWESKYRQDPLTGLLNHEAFRNDVELELLSREEGRAMLLMLDVDHFKQYNDQFGHRAGDEFLILVARALTASLRDGDLASRMGGDEFAAMLFFPNTVSEETMKERGRDLCEHMELLLSTNSHGTTSVSVGGAILDREHYSFDRLYEAADKALYRAKDAGRARFSL